MTDPAWEDCLEAVLAFLDDPPAPDTPAGQVLQRRGLDQRPDALFATDPAAHAPLGKQTAQRFGADAEVGGQLALAKRQFHTIALVGGQLQQISGQPLGRAAGRQPFNFIDIAV